MTRTSSTHALVLLDYQEAAFESVPGSRDIIPAVARIATRVAENHTVIYITVGFRQGYPEISDRNPVFSPVRDYGMMIEGSAEGALAKGLAPSAECLRLTKRRVNAFAGTDLDMILRARGIDSITLAGIATSGAVLATLLDASDRDYRMTVLSDLCRDPNEEIGRLLIEKVFPARSRVCTSDEWVQGL